MLLVGVAMAIGTAVGQAGAEEQPTVQMPGQQRGARLSLLTVGIGDIGQVVRQVRVGIEYVRQH
jgi:hypothetical protein